MPFGGLLTVGLISAGGALGGAAINAHAQGDAADKSLAASQAGIDYLKEEKKQERADFAPYAAAGGGALSKLSFGLGIGNQGDYTSNGAPKSLTPPGDPRVSPSSPAGQVIQNAQSGSAQMMAPDGSVSTVQAKDVPHYVQLGAKVVGQSLPGGPSAFGSLAAPQSAGVSAYRQEGGRA